MSLLQKSILIIFSPLLILRLCKNCKSKTSIFICRPGETAKYLKESVQVRFDPEGHSKNLVGDSAALLGSFNLTYQSLFDNQENATYSRSEDYADFFLEVWERATIPGEYRGS